MTAQEKVNYKNTKILSLALAPLQPDEIIVNTPIRLYYSVNFSLSDSPAKRPQTLNTDAWKLAEIPINYKPTIKFINELQTIEVGEKKLTELLSFCGTSLWQFIPSYSWPQFYYSVELIRIVNQLVQIHEPRFIRAFSSKDWNQDIWNGVINGVGTKWSIQILKAENNILDFFSFPSATIRSIFRHYGIGLIIDRFIGKLERIFLWSISQLKPTNRSNRKTSSPKILLVTIPRHWTKRPENPETFYDEQFDSIVDALEKNNMDNLIGIECPYGPWRTSISTLFRRVFESRYHFRWRSFYAYSRPLLTKRYSFRNELNQLLSNEQFASDFSYEGISLLAPFEKTLRSSFERILPSCAELISIAGKALDIEKPDLVLLSYETGPFQRAMLVESARRNIPTVGLMHGNIFDNHYDYMHSKLSPNLEDSSQSFIIPTTLCVWGPYWKKILTEYGNYPPENVSVTGFWRYDKHFNKLNSRENNVVIGKKKTVVLILSSGQEVPRFIQQTLFALRRFEPCSPLIKLHPGDNRYAVDALLREMTVNPEINLNCHLIQALENADIVISQPSTAIAEAALMDKPVIAFDLLKMNDQNYQDSKICLLARTESELIGSLENILCNPTVQKELRDSRQRFIERFFLCRDGKSSERVLEQLGGFLNGVQRDK